MKKTIFSVILLISAVNITSAQEYYIDKKINDSHSENNSYAGVVTRAGYGFNYDAFTYGASLVYHFENSLGVSLGFDAYHIPNKYTTTSDGTEVQLSYVNLPLWNIRAGLLIGKYFSIGALAGKWTIDNSNYINMKQNAWFINNSDSKAIFGGWATFILPLGKYFGFNLDLAVTNKTGFNIGAGINLTIPVK